MENNVDFFYSPIQILDKITPIDRSQELTDLDFAFLCGLIKKYNPHKILEIGVTTGVTTSLLMSCIDMLNLNSTCEIFSIGENEYLSFAEGNHTGFLINETKLFLEKPVYNKLIIGNIIPNQIDLIGQDIDFIILNTTPLFPDVFFVFLSIYPYLKKDACVVLNDINSLHSSSGSTDPIATQLLLNTIVGEKIFPNYYNNKCGVSTIGAIIITDDTKKYISDCFRILSLAWEHIPAQEELNQLRHFLVQHYSSYLMNIFDDAVKRQDNNTHLAIQTSSVSNKICKSYKIGLALTYIPRAIHHAIHPNKQDDSSWEEQRHLIKKGALEAARQIHLSKKNYIFSDKKLKPKFYLPNYKEDLIQQSIIYNKTYFEDKNLHFVTKEWCHGLIGNQIKNSMVLDIGSNIGNHALYFLLECDASKVHCFEPIQSTYNVLEKNISINQLENRVCLHNVAVGKAAGKSSIAHYDPNNIGGTSLKEEENGSIQVVSIDELKIIDEISLIKIDVEGFEKNVIDGTMRTIATHRPYMMIEIQRDNLTYITNKLQSFGYCYVYLGGIDYLFFNTEKPAI